MNLADFELHDAAWPQLVPRKRVQPAPIRVIVCVGCFQKEITVGSADTVDEIGAAVVDAIHEMGSPA